MKTIAILAAVLYGVTLIGYSQGLTKNAKGESSILFRGTNINFDLGDSELKANINNLKSSLGKDTTLIYGIQISGKSDAGVASIFNAGDFVPAASVSAYFGFSRAWGVPENFEKEFNSTLTNWKNYEKNFVRSYQSSLSKEISRFKTSTSSLQAYQLDTALISNYVDLSDFKMILENLQPTDNAGKNMKTELLKKVDKFLTQHEDSVAVAERKARRAQDMLAYGKKYHQLMIFAFGGFEGSEFKRLITLDTNSFSNSFADISYRGGWGGIGANFQVGRWMFGTTWASRSLHNFDLLNKKDYTLRTTRTITNTTLVEEKKITAYSGDYGTVWVNEWKVDATYRLSLNDEDKNQLLLNLYLNAQSASSNSKLLPNRANIGLGTYFFNKENKFLGGLYIELPDIENNYEKAKPVADRNLRTAVNRLTFGIVAKFSIGSLMNTF